VVRHYTNGVSHGLRLKGSLHRLRLPMPRSKRDMQLTVRCGGRWRPAKRGALHLTWKHNCGSRPYRRDKTCTFAHVSRSGVHKKLWPGVWTSFAVGLGNQTGSGSERAMVSRQVGRKFCPPASKITIRNFFVAEEGARAGRLARLRRRFSLAMGAHL
jgi:hypothetical protein